MNLPLKLYTFNCFNNKVKKVRKQFNVSDANKGRVVLSVEHLIWLRNCRKSVVVCEYTYSLHPASVVCNWQFGHIIHLIKHERIYEYIKLKK